MIVNTRLIKVSESVLHSLFRGDHPFPIALIQNNMPAFLDYFNPKIYIIRYVLEVIRKVY